jgi:hypothetical protein
MKSWMIGLLTALLILGATGLALAEANDREFYVKVSMQNFGLEDDFDGSYYGTEDGTKAVTAPRIDEHNSPGFTIGERIGRFAGELSYYRAKLPSVFDLFYGTNEIVSNKSDCDLISVDFKYYLIDPRESDFALYALVGYCRTSLDVTGNVSYSANNNRGNSTFKGDGYNAGIGFLYQFGALALDGAYLYQDLGFNRVKFDGDQYKPQTDIESKTSMVRVGVVYRF